MDRLDRGTDNSQGMISYAGPLFTKRSRLTGTENKRFDDFVTDGTVECRNDNLRMRKWRQSFQYV